MKRTAPVLGALLAGLLPALTTSSAVGPPAPPPAEAAALVRQLAGESFAARQASGRRLVRLGRAAAPAVRAGLKSDDAEVRRRCARLLEEIELPELEPRLRALLAGRDDIAPPLPGWARYRELAGDDKEARRLYVELYQADRELLELLPGDPELLREAFDRRLARVRAWVQAEDDGETPTKLTVPALAGVVLAEMATGDSSKVTVLGGRIGFKNQVGRHPGLRRLVVRYLERLGHHPKRLGPALGAARELDLWPLLDEKLWPLLERQFDAALGQSPDLDRLREAVLAAVEGRLIDRVPECVRAVVRSLARKAAVPPFDVRRSERVMLLLYWLDLPLFDDLIRPTLLGWAELFLDRPPDEDEYGRFVVLWNMSTTRDYEPLRAAVCRVVVADAAHFGDPARLRRALSLSHNSFALEEVYKAVVVPAARKRVLSLLEQPDDLRRLSEASDLDFYFDLGLRTDTLQPVFLRQADRVFAGPADIDALYQLHHFADRAEERFAVEGRIRAALGKLLTAGGPLEAATLDQKLNLAWGLGMKEGVPLAVRAARSTSLPAATRGRSVLLAALLATPGQFGHLETLLTDDARVGRQSLDGDVREARLGDVVLAGLVGRSGQKLTDYGFSETADIRYYPFPQNFGFRSESARRRARARWNAWCAANKR